MVKKRAPRPRARRIRLTGEDARARILDAAVVKLRDGGLASLTLSQLGKELGVSHQAILHHFGSRDGLVSAVVARVLESLHAELAGGLRVISDPDHGTAALLDRAFEVLVDQGHGRLLAWLALESPDPGAMEAARPLEMLAKLAHVVRERELGPTDYRDTAHSVMLLAYTMIGAAVCEPGTLTAAGLANDPDASMKFRRWVREVVVAHLRRAPGT